MNFSLIKDTAGPRENTPSTEMTSKHSGKDTPKSNFSDSPRGDFFNHFEQSSTFLTNNNNHIGGNSSSSSYRNSPDLSVVALKNKILSNNYDSFELDSPYSNSPKSGSKAGTATTSNTIKQFLSFLKRDRDLL